MATSLPRRARRSLRLPASWATEINFQSRYPGGILIPKIGAASSSACPDAGAQKKTTPAKVATATRKKVILSMMDPPTRLKQSKDQSLMSSNPKSFLRVMGEFFLEATPSDQKRGGEAIRRWYQRYDTFLSPRLAAGAADSRCRGGGRCCGDRRKHIVKRLHRLHLGILVGHRYGHNADLVVIRQPDGLNADRQVDRIGEQIGVSIRNIFTRGVVVM